MTDRITFFKSYFDGASEMADDERLAFYEGAFRYAFYGEEPEFDTPLQRAAWSFMFPTLESGIAKQAAGRKGGNVKSNAASNAESSQTSNKASKPPSTRKSTTGSTQKSTQKSNAASNAESSQTSNKASKPPSTPSETEEEVEEEGNKNLPLEEDSYSRSPDGADADGSAPPGEPKCGLCGSTLEKTGMADADFWWCSACRETYPREKVVA